MGRGQPRPISIGRSVGEKKNLNHEKHEKHECFPENSEGQTLDARLGRASEVDEQAER